MKKMIVHNLPSIPKNAEIYFNMSTSFGKQLEIRKQIKTFCEQPGIKTAWLSRKRISTSKSLKEFKEFNSPKHFFSMFDEGDDSFQVFYTEKSA